MNSYIQIQKKSKYKKSKYKKIPNTKHRKDCKTALISELKKMSFLSGRKDNNKNNETGTVKVPVTSSDHVYQMFQLNKN